MVDTLPTQGDRPTSPILISSSPEPPSPLSLGKSPKDPEHQDRSGRPKTVNTKSSSAATTTISAEDPVPRVSTKPHGNGNNRPSVSSFSSITSAPLSGKKITTLLSNPEPSSNTISTMTEQGGDNEASDPDTELMAKTSTNLSKDHDSTSSLRLELPLDLNNDLYQDQPSLTTTPSPPQSLDLINTLTTTIKPPLLPQPRRSRKQPPYNLLPIIKKIATGDPEYINHPVRAFIAASPDFIKHKRDEEPTRCAATRIEQNSAQADQVKSANNDIQPSSPIERESTTPDSEPQANRSRPTYLYSKILLSMSRSTMGARSIQDTDSDTGSDSESEQDRPVSTSDVDEDAAAAEDNDNITHPTIVEDPNDEDNGNDNTTEGTSSRTGATVLTSRRSRGRPRGSRKAQEPENKDSNQRFPKPQGRDRKGRFARRSYR